MSKTQGRRAPELERRVRRTVGALEALLDPSGVSRRGSVLADLLYRAQHPALPDGFPTSSAAAAPALNRPTSQQGLRTDPGDALRRKREHGYADGSSVEKAVESILEDVCDKCGGARRVIPKMGRAATPEEVAAEVPTVECPGCGGSGRRFHDPVTEAVGELVDALDQVVRLTRVIDKKRQIVLHARDQAPTESAAEDCLGCHRKVYGGRGDPIRRGLCHTCANAYYIWRVDNGSVDESADRARWCMIVGPDRRHEGHLPGTCDRCAEERRKASDEWRLDRADEMRSQA